MGASIRGSNLPSMGKWIRAGVFVTLVSFQLLNSIEAKNIPQQLQIQGSPDEKQGVLVPEMDFGDDDGGAMEASILNYLYTKQMLQRMRQQAELTDPIRKRNNGYWKQCAFNAVSCFG